MATLAAEETTTKLTVGADGQITLPESTLHHLGIGAGGRVEFDLLPGGRIQFRRARTGTINDFIGSLAGKSDKVLTIEEINAVSGPDLEDFR